MSNLAYPVLRGLEFPVVRRVKWNTLVANALSTKTATLSLQQYALYEWEFTYDLLRDDQTPSDYKEITGFFNQHGGQFDSFLYNDPTFNTVVDEPMGVGDGSNKDFQTIANFHNAGGPGRADIIQNFNGTPVFKVNGVITSASVGPSGIITFASAPANNAAITWTGGFFYRCRFTQDKLPISQFMNNWWSVDQPIVIGSILL